MNWVKLAIFFLICQWYCNYQHQWLWSWWLCTLYVLTDWPWQEWAVTITTCSELAHGRQLNCNSTATRAPWSCRHAQRGLFTYRTQGWQNCVSRSFVLQLCKPTSHQHLELLFISGSISEMIVQNPSGFCPSLSIFKYDILASTMHIHLYIQIL